MRSFLLEGSSMKSFFDGLKARVQAKNLLRAMCLCVGLLLSAHPAQAAAPLKLGVWPYLTAQQALTYYEGLRLQLEKSLRQPVQIETAPSIDVFVERMRRAEYDIAVSAPHLARVMQADYGWQPVARYSPDNTVYLVTRKKNGITSLAALKGKTISTPNRSMLVNMVAEDSLQAQGISGPDVEWDETGGMASSVFAVTAGQADAAITTLASLAMTPQAEMNQLKILADFGKVPHLFVMAAPQVSRQQLEAAKAACLRYQHNGKPQLGSLNKADLVRLDGYAARVRVLFNKQLTLPSAGKGVP
jgi:phosphonate transport system substrate-binding protein